MLPPNAACDRLRDWQPELYHDLVEEFHFLDEGSRMLSFYEAPIFDSLATNRYPAWLEGVRDFVFQLQLVGQRIGRERGTDMNPLWRVVITYVTGATPSPGNGALGICIWREPSEDGLPVQGHTDMVRRLYDAMRRQTAHFWQDID